MATGEFAIETMLKEFGFVKSGGVKALVDSGVVKIPEVFVHPPEDLPNESDSNGKFNEEIPVIDLEGVHGVTVEQIRKASETWGFFQVVNHGIPPSVLDEMIDGVRRFHEQTVEEKVKFISTHVIYGSGADSVKSKAAVWRDSLDCVLDELATKTLPSVCREIVIVYAGWITKLKDLLSELLSEALGLNHDNLSHTECMNGMGWAGIYYPACPEPDVTLGAIKHTDMSCFTILLQDEIGGLQVLYQNQWKDVAPVKGALVVNIGDFLQAMSNDKIKSGMHRVIARSIGPRISVPMFVYPKDHQAKLIGPIKELLSKDDPPVYKKFSYDEFYNVGIQDAKSALPHFKL